MAFAFQFLLTNLSLAAGISSEENHLEAEAPSTWSGKVREVESKIGIWSLITVNLALFTACFLAVKLTLINTVSLGAITGVVIWSAFFLVLLWLSSKAVNSLFGSVADTASSSLQGIMGIAATALGGNAVNTQVVNTVTESVASVRRELSSAVDSSGIQKQLQGYLKQLQSPQLNLQGISKDFEQLLKSSDLKSIADSGNLANIDRQSFVDLVSSRTDLSKEDINQVAEQLEKAWNNVVSQPQSSSLEGLQDILKSLTQDDENQQSSLLGKPGVGLGVSAILSTVLNQLNLPNLNQKEVGGQLQKLLQEITERTEKITESKPKSQSNTIQADITDYLLYSKPWHLNRETIKQEFRDVIYDPEANPGMVRQQLEQLNLDFFVETLNQRDEFNAEKVNDIAKQLQEIRQDVFEQVQAADSEAQSNNLIEQIKNYLRSTNKEELNPEGIAQEFKTLLADPEVGFEQLQNRLSQFDRDTLKQMLQEAREDVSEEEADNIVNQLESVRDRVLGEAKDAQEQAASQAEELGTKIESYLRDTNKDELNPEGIKKDLQTLLSEPKQGVKVLRERLSQFDRDTLVKLLSERGDLSEEEVNQFVDRFLQLRKTFLNAPKELAGKVKEQSEAVTQKIGDYLRKTNLEELNPEGIQQELNQLFSDPEQGLKNLQNRLSHVDRETLVKLLSQREDVSEEQIDGIVDNVQEAVNNIVKAPRRWANRTLDRVQTWETQFEDYLLKTEKEELNPEGIKRDLQLLLQQPGYGLEQIRDRISHFDRDTVISLLAQREDISQEEAQQIVDRLESTRDRLFQQAQELQDKAQSAVNGVFDQIRNYLNSMERPELNYEGIQQDLQQLLEDPEAGWEGLRDRLSQFDRDTLVALLSSNKQISEADANRLINEIEQIRDRTLNRAERLQEQAQQKIREIQDNAKQQLKETRKVAATAAWWLFGTALTSVGMAALAGVIAVRGLAFLG